MHRGLLSSEKTRVARVFLLATPPGIHPPGWGGVCPLIFWRHTLQIALFKGPAPVEKPVRAPAVAKPPAGPVDVKATYRTWKADTAWMAVHYEELHLWLLRRQLWLLADPQVGDDERTDLLEWLLAEDTPTPPAPFSFRACVALYDPRIEAAEMRRQVLRMLKKSRLDRPQQRAA